jgi:hypothetical protein
MAAMGFQPFFEGSPIDYRQAMLQGLVQDFPSVLLSHILPIQGYQSGAIVYSNKNIIKNLHTFGFIL